MNFSPLRLILRKDRSTTTTQRRLLRVSADNGFFAAKHTINLISGEKLEITTRKELEDIIAKEKDAILKDKELRKKFDEIAKLLEKNATLRDFQA